MRRWRYNIKMDVIGCEPVDWIHLAQDRVHWRGTMNTESIKVKVKLPLCFS